MKTRTTIKTITRFDESQNIGFDVLNLGGHLNDLVKCIGTDSTKIICKITHILDDVRRNPKISKTTINGLISLAKENLELNSKILTAFEQIKEVK